MNKGFENGQEGGFSMSNGTRVYVDVSYEEFAELKTIASLQNRSPASVAHAAIKRLIRKESFTERNRGEGDIDIFVRLRADEVKALRELADQKKQSLGAMARGAILSFLHHVSHNRKVAGGESKSVRCSNGHGQEVRQATGLDWLRQ
jgi:hypothetical protein